MAASSREIVLSCFCTWTGRDHKPVQRQAPNLELPFTEKLKKNETRQNGKNKFYGTSAVTKT